MLGVSSIIFQTIGFYKLRWNHLWKKYTTLAKNKAKHLTSKVCYYMLLGNTLILLSFTGNSTSCQVWRLGSDPWNPHGRSKASKSYELPPYHFTHLHIHTKGMLSKMSLILGNVNSMQHICSPGFNFKKSESFMTQLILTPTTYVIEYEKLYSKVKIHSPNYIKTWTSTI